MAAAVTEACVLVNGEVEEVVDDLFGAQRPLKPVYTLRCTRCTLHQSRCADLVTTMTAPV